MAEKSPQVEPGAGAEESVRAEVHEKVTKERTTSRKLFGTFSGVFTPTLLTILGVIMFLREGWVVGNAGLLGAWAIILISFTITTFTALSLASITTNIRIGAGGAFSIISQSLGLEVGGSIGIPLYISQALAVAMYIFGFRAGWMWVFPDHSPLMVDLIVFGVLFVIGFISAGLAFKVQYVILVIIIGSLVSVVASLFTGWTAQPIQWLGTYPGSPETGFQGIGFWAVFAVFFPASTGIMAGANMSGDLKDPRKSIPQGTLWAIGLSLVIYLFLAWWLAASASTEDLVSNYTIMIDRAAWGPAVLAGLLGATFSSALSSLVGAPRILQALSQHRIVPGSKWLSVRTSEGEPRNSMLFTGVLVLGALMLRNLNAIAPLITMFFLVTYSMINLVVFMEQSLRLVSFRPLIRIPRLVSLLGGAGCVSVMFIVNPVFGLLSVVIVIALYAYLIRKQLKAPFGDVRSGLFTALAEWGAKKIESLAGESAKTWKANLLVPVEASVQVLSIYNLLKNIAYPKGFVRLLGLTGKKNYRELTEKLPGLADSFQEDGIFSTWTVIEAATFSENLVAGIEALGGAFFRSSIIFLRFPESKQREEDIREIVKEAQKYDLGVLILAGEVNKESTSLPIQVVIDRPEKDWQIELDLGPSDLALLTAYKLKINWSTDLLLTARIEATDHETPALDYLKSVSELARLPNASYRAVLGTDQLDKGLDVGISLTFYSFSGEIDFDLMRQEIKSAGTPCLLAMDSGLENALI